MLPRPPQNSGNSGGRSEFFECCQGHLTIREIRVGGQNFSNVAKATSKFGKFGWEVRIFRMLPRPPHNSGNSGGRSEFFECCQGHLKIREIRVGGQNFSNVAKATSQFGKFGWEVRIFRMLPRPPQNSGNSGGRSTFFEC